MNTKTFILFVVGAAVILPVTVLIAQGRFFMAGLLVAGLVFLILFRRPDLWWTVAVVSVGSNLHLYMGNASVHLISSAGFAFLGIMLFIMTQGRTAGNLDSVPRKAAFVLLVVLVVTASIRGWGLRILGSSNWGGMQYIMVLAGLGFYLFSDRIFISEERAWRVVRGMCLFGLLPAAALLILMVVPAAGVVLLRLIRVVGGGDAATEGFGMQRLAGMQASAVWAGVSALLFYERRSRVTPAVLVMTFLSFIMLGMAGHRTVVVLLGLTVLIYVWVRRKTTNPGQILMTIVAGGVIMAALYLFIDLLPVTFQRAFAFMPGIRVVEEAAMDASATTEWRIEMWRTMIPMLPQYLLIGRGLGFDLAEAYSAYTMASDYNYHHFMIATHNYHNGPLWLLMDLGIAGLLSGIFLMFGGMVHYRKRLDAIPEGTLWRSAYTVTYAFFSGYCIFFFVVMGTHNILPRILVLASVLEVISRSVIRAQVEQHAPVRAFGGRAERWDETGGRRPWNAPWAPMPQGAAKKYARFGPP